MCLLIINSHSIEVFLNCDIIQKSNLIWESFVNLKLIGAIGICSFSLVAFAQELPIKLEDEIKVLSEVQIALNNSNCAMEISTTAENAFVKISNKSKDEVMNLNEQLTTKSFSRQDGIETLRYETNWSPSGVLFTEIDYRTRLIITKTDGRISNVTLKSRDKGFTIFYPVLKFSKVLCNIKG